MARPLSLYIHIPWCIRKCPYCDFNSHAAGAELPEKDYVDALLADLQEEIEFSGRRELGSIFFGGGTPSLFSAVAIERILNGVDAQLGIDTHCEITLEANPGTFEQERFRAYREAGINRLSVGVQSFQDPQLQALGRVHSSAEASAAIGRLRDAGFDNFNIDLMHGLPGQTVEAAMADLRQAFDLQPEHLSWYQLTIEANTAFYSAPPQLPDDEVLADIQDAGEEALAEAGFSHYEVSAYAQPGRESRHNYNYWTFGDYIGIGAGAHGKITLGDAQVLRRQKSRLPKDYLDPEKRFLAKQEEIDGERLCFEFMLNALRLRDGVDADLFRARTGLDWSVAASRWQSLQERGLVEPAAKRLCTSPLGWRFLNDVLQAFTPQ